MPLSTALALLSALLLLPLAEGDSLSRSERSDGAICRGVLLSGSR
jgi:hypothetical protein